MKKMYNLNFKVQDISDPGLYKSK